MGPVIRGSLVSIGSLHRGSNRRTQEQYFGRPWAPRRAMIIMRALTADLSWNR